MRTSFLFASMVVLAAGLLACQPAATADDASQIGSNVDNDNPKIADDVSQALSLLPGAQVAAVGAGGVPSFITGNLGSATNALVPGDALAVPLAHIAPVFRLDTQSLTAVSSDVDDLGQTHVRYAQSKNGLDVVGGELILHVNAAGTVFAANGSARDGVNLAATPAFDELSAQNAAANARMIANQTVGDPRLVYLIASSDSSMHLAYEVEIDGLENGMPVRDLVYVDAKTGAIADVHPQIETALNRKTYSANNGTSLPGTLKRSEGQAANSDAQVNYAYDNTGATYNAYKALFNRDSFDNAGATLISTVHYDQSYNNAYWDGTQMVYGDGDGTEMTPLADALDVTAHELTHAVTERSSNLTYSNESGAINESMSDCMGETVESWQRGNGNVLAGVTSDTWKVGEVIWTPSTAGDALRYMDNPTKDGYSKDYYPERITGSSDNGGVHGNSGISNLAFYLLSQGGHHPRNKTTVTVTGIGLDKAAAIFYRANTKYLTANAQFADLRTAAAQAATDLYGAAEVASVQAAFDAVGVPGGSGGSGGGGGGGGSTPVALTNGTAATNLSAATGSQLFFTLAVPAGATNLKFTTSGGTGDSDLYVKFGATPTSSSYDCRPYQSGNSESCSFATPSTGTYYVMLNAYASFSGLSLTGSYTSGTTGTSDFSLTLTPTSVTVAAGSTAKITVGSAIVSGSAESIALSVTSLPTGVTASFSPATITSGQSSVLTLTASSSAVNIVGDSITIKGTATSGSHSKTAHVTVTGGTVLNDFSITLGTTAVTLNPGSSATIKITSAVTVGSAESIKLTASSLPTGVTASFSPATITAGGSSTLTLTASSTAPAISSDAITIKGTATSAAHSRTAHVTVN